MSRAALRAALSEAASAAGAASAAAPRLHERRHGDVRLRRLPQRALLRLEPERRQRAVVRPAARRMHTIRALASASTCAARTAHRSLDAGLETSATVTFYFFSHGVSGCSLHKAYGSADACAFVILQLSCDRLRQGLVWYKSLANMSTSDPLHFGHRAWARRAPARDAAGKHTARMRQQIRCHECAIPGQAPATQPQRSS